MKKVFLVAVLTLCFGIVLLNYGCGSTTSTPTTTINTTTTTIASATISLSGSMATGSISSAGIRSFAAASDYSVVVIDHATNQTYSTSTLEVSFSKPLDEDGNVLAGLSYSITVGSCEASGSSSRLPVPTNNQGFRENEYPAAFTDGATTMTVSLHDLVTFEADTYYYITPVAESADGQRNGEETWWLKL